MGVVGASCAHRARVENPSAVFTKTLGFPRWFGCADLGMMTEAAFSPAVMVAVTNKPGRQRPSRVWKLDAGGGRCGSPPGGPGRRS